MEQTSTVSYLFGALYSEYVCVRIFVASFVFLELDLLFVKSNSHKVSALDYAGVVRRGD